jgi:PleD family two-component response regulator
MLRKKISEHIFGLVGNKTISIGLTINKKGDTTQRVIQRADEALYIAKNGGRNKIEVL